MDELISIIIPAYQEENRIGRCLKNILQSTYSPVELIVVNDGSTDRTEEIVRDFIKKTSREGWEIRLVNIANGGSAHARNTGLGYVRGQFIGFADADDMIHPRMIEWLAESLHGGSDIAVCGQVICNENGKKAWKKRQYAIKERHKKCPTDALTMVMWDQIVMSSCRALFRKEKIFNKQGTLQISFPEKVTVFEDFAFVCEYVYQCRGILEVLPFYGYYYCKRKGSLTSRRYLAAELADALEPVMEIGRQIGGSFCTHKVQYAFRFMAYWYEEMYRYHKKEVPPDMENLKICRREMERYAGLYLGASNVSLHRKLAFWIAWKRPRLSRMLVNVLGRVVL